MIDPEDKAEVYRENLKRGIWGYSEIYDAYYETKTRKWLERQCDDKGCGYCSRRPRLAPVQQ
jgi:hypothetical protein